MATGSMRIGDRLVGEGYPCLIIAEAGSNFDGDIDVAKKLINVAATAGADAVKFQTFRAEKLITANVLKPYYQNKGGIDKETYQDSLKKFEITKEEHIELKQYCKKKKIMFLSTPHAQEESVDLLDSIGVPAYKIASGDLTNLPFLGYVARKGKPIILSTGMSTIPEIKEALSLIKEAGNDKLIVLQCTSAYPCDVKDVNLLAMKTIQQQCNVLVGLSDHTTTLSVPAAAAALGAVAIEKHFTLDREREGPDHKASLEPDELAQMISYVREVEKALGSPKKKPNKIESELLDSIRKSIIAARDIKSGEIISNEMVEIKRPGTGLAPKNLDKITGKIAKVDIKKDELIRLTQLNDK